VTEQPERFVNVDTANAAAVLRRVRGEKESAARHDAAPGSDGWTDGAPSLPAKTSVATRREARGTGASIDTAEPGMCRHERCFRAAVRPDAYCDQHGCTRCGGAILADTEDDPDPLCYECWRLVELGRPKATSSSAALPEANRRIASEAVRHGLAGFQRWSQRLPGPGAPPIFYLDPYATQQHLMCASRVEDDDLRGCELRYSVQGQSQRIAAILASDEPATPWHCYGDGGEG